MSELPFAATTPISVAQVGLKARDAKALADYYSAIVGLEQLSSDGETITLGAKGRPLLVIEGDKAAKPDDPRSAGLFHTAFLLPSRADLGRWINFAAERQIKIDGASDHLVSEALYLTDPEGNGIEIYADRMPTEWKRNGIRSPWRPQRMDIPGVRASVPAGDEAGRARRKTRSSAMCICRVGDPVAAEDWWHKDARLRHGREIRRAGGVPLDRRLPPPYRREHMAERGRRPARQGQVRPGLVELRSSDAKAKSSYEDPWGTEIRVVPGKPPNETKPVN